MLPKLPQLTNSFHSNRSELEIGEILHEIEENAPPRPTSTPGGEADISQQSHGSYVAPSHEPKFSRQESSNKDLRDLKQRLDRAEKLLKYTAIFAVAVTILMIILFAVSIAIASQNNSVPANQPSSISSPSSQTTASAASLGISSQNAAAFTPQQLAALNETLSVVRGPPGIDGRPGKDGLNGTDGKDGLPGTNGRNGAKGADGRDGTNGTCIGVLGVGETHTPGGYTGWEYHGGFTFRYPLDDIFAKVGDTILFRGFLNRYPSQIQHIWDDVVLFNDAHAWNICNLSSPSVVGIATYMDLRTLPDGFRFKLAPQHAGKTLHFANRRGGTGQWGRCRLGIKVRVHVVPRLEIPIRNIENQDNQADSQTVLKLRNTVAQLSRLAILTQLQLEQRIRSEGHSGLTDSRGSSKGLKPYNDGHYTVGGIAAIHNHADFIRVIGMGELQGVLNGVEFATRHNDYNLQMPHRTDNRYGRTEYIEFPDVPPSVLNKSTVAEQVKEMQEWFRAFKNQDWRVRDYRKYFKPVLCYMEGTWIQSTDGLDDPFLSDRHQLDAKTWRQLHDKMRFYANSGRKNLLENIAFLPHSVRDLLNDTWPILANWEYRILCHPLKDDLPLQRLRVVPDLSTQLQTTPITREELGTSRKARYQLNEYTWGAKIAYPTMRHDGVQSTIPWHEGRTWWGYLDYLMEQIPGKDNYQANLTDSLAGGIDPAYHFYADDYGKLNAGYYSRYYSVKGLDAMGTSRHRRGFHDQWLWAAKTTQEKVSNVGYDEDIKVDPKCSSNCPTKKARGDGKWSYAIPMEIIFLTPLSKWNPYNVTIQNTVSETTKNGRNGKCTPEQAYNGVHERRPFFMTPAEFFGGGLTTGAGDTVTNGDTCVLDSNGIMRAMRATGHWIIFPKIGGGVGKIRQRYPIMPIHESGSTAYKEMKSLQELVLNNDYDQTKHGYFGDSRDEKYGFTVEIDGGGHQHFIVLRPGDVARWKHANGTWDTSGSLIVEATSDKRNNHQHTVRIARVLDANNKWKYLIRECKYVEGNSNFTVNRCDDGHSDIFRAV